ncbi:hypothetical protein [Ornithinibacillus scapharcae]|uniref:hypothetical protein n=1 Tax=Ornithinibacillus scapharcae TaxID=1147159 RepID=UPI000225AFFE|nr:hypothetical protein [Ornithinibacillus scapharcae]
MKSHQVRLGLYLLAIIITCLLLLTPLISDITINHSLLSKILISVPFVLVIIGKMISIWEKKAGNKSFSGDIGINIGLILGLVFFALL